MADYWGLIETPLGWQAGAVDQDGAITGLFFVGRARPTKAKIEHWLPISDKRRDDAALGLLRRQVSEYFDAKRRRFELPLAPRGSDFQKQVWKALERISFGETTTYGALAAKLGRPKAARAVGRANATNPISLVIPCHRVIGSGGALTGYAGGLPVKEALLALERRT